MNAIERATLVADAIILKGTWVAKFDSDNLPYVQYAFENILDAGRSDQDYLYVDTAEIMKGTSRVIFTYEGHQIAFDSKEHPELFAAVGDLGCIINGKFLKVMCETSDVIADLRSHLEWIYCQIEDARDIVVGKVTKLVEYTRGFDQEVTDLKTKYHKDSVVNLYHADGVSS